MPRVEFEDTISAGERPKTYASDRAATGTGIDTSCEIKCSIAVAKAAFNKKRALFTSTLDLKLRKKLLKCSIWNIESYGAETWTLRAVDQKHLESFEMWCWRRIEKISWTDHVRNEEALLTVNEQRNILHEISKRKANWIGHILRRNYNGLLKKR